MLLVIGKNFLEIVLKTLWKMMSVKCTSFSALRKKPEHYILNYLKHIQTGHMCNSFMIL